MSQHLNQIYAIILNEIQQQVNYFRHSYYYFVLRLIGWGQIKGGSTIQPSTTAPSKST